MHCLLVFPYQMHALPTHQAKRDNLNVLELNLPLQYCRTQIIPVFTAHTVVANVKLFGTAPMAKL